MSIQFGKWHFEGEPAPPEYLKKVSALMERYGPHGGGSYTEGGLSILFRAFHSTGEAAREIQPHVTPTGTVITWDGRLDNREELIAQFPAAISTQSSDIVVVAAAYERWNIHSFAKLIGDWALSIWDPRHRILILAKDAIGARHLYYVADRTRVIWSTTLDPLVLLAQTSHVLDEEYVAGWLSTFPACHRTPYAGIHSVPPSSFVSIQPTQCSTTQYWDFDAHKIIRYRTDTEFEEHFRTLFHASVRRRLRSNAPVLAELSGGMDSSAVVCVADAIIAAGYGGTPRLDTISYYNESEPNWNERPFFSKVEQKRGRTGCHVDTTSHSDLPFQFEINRFAPTPGCRTRWSEPRKKFAALLSSQGNRVVLSGIGGDEVMGGVPTATPELANLLASARLGELVRQLAAWALSKRRPWPHILLEVGREFCPQPLRSQPDHLRPAAWLRPDFVQRNRSCMTDHRTRLKLFGALPSFQENIKTLQMLRRQLACTSLRNDPRCEMRYPYLDRDLLEFMYAIPREQILRPNERRSLMRRSLRGLVPEDILNRRRKAYISQGPLLQICAVLPEMAAMRDRLHLKLFGIVDTDRFFLELQDAGRGLTASSLLLARAIWLERWLEHVSRWGLLKPSVSNAPKQSTIPCNRAHVSQLRYSQEKGGENT